jgi:signal transduction histidine kinase
LADLLALSKGDSYLDQAQWQALIHPEDLDTLQNTLARAIRQAGEGEGAVVRVRSGPDSYNWLALNGRVSQRNATGQAVTVTGLARDVTEQQRASDMVRDRTAQLDAIFRLSPDGYVSFDEHHKVKYVNPAFVTMTGWDAAAMKGLSEGDFSTRLGQLCIPERPPRSLATLRHAALETGDIPCDVIELTGTPRRIVRVSLQLSHAPTVTQILYMRDVTHETMVEDMKTEFLATAAHELRTPMASIVGFAEILCTHPLPPADQLEFAQIIWRQSLHLAGILDELLDLSRIEARGGKGLLFETLDLRTQLAEVIHAFALPKGRDAPLVTLPPLPCKADSGKVRQVLDNVLSNAYKYSGPGTAISISAAEPSQHPVSGRALVGLVIRDAGIGMTSEQLSRVYERFYRADKTGAVPGNGLGLSITREIMGLLNGQISISSAPQQGTAVTLLFPVADAPAAELPAQAAAVPSTLG